MHLRRFACELMRASERVMHIFRLVSTNHQPEPVSKMRPSAHTALCLCCECESTRWSRRSHHVTRISAHAPHLTMVGLKSESGFTSRLPPPSSPELSPRLQVSRLMS
ncbi:hypothetical protein RRG08_060567 [Elysia crispata]|uniref:Uncharacterized protein n=1 Tax=Elysia crispata TaxID=231223 RepID=A0AAE1AMP8_9GAST|nr:hypothetical protein RRG08_060567 [Elysia crispata]